MSAGFSMIGFLIFLAGLMLRRRSQDNNGMERSQTG